MMVLLLVLRDQWLCLLHVLFYSRLCNADGTNGVVEFHCKDDFLWLKELGKLLPFSRLRCNLMLCIENATQMQP